MGLVTFVLLFNLFIAVFSKPEPLGHEKHGELMHSNMTLLTVNQQLMLVHAGNSDERFVGHVNNGVLFSGRGSLRIEGHVINGGVILSGEGDIVVTGNINGGYVITGRGSNNVRGNIRGNIVTVGSGSLVVNGSHSEGSVLNLGDVEIEIKGG